MPKPLLLRRPSGLYVRLLVPLHLRQAVGSRFIVRSLGGLTGDAARLAAARLGYTLGLAWEQGNPAVPDFRKWEIRGTPGMPDFSLKTDGTAADSAGALEALKLLSVPRLPDPLPTPRLGRLVALFLRQFERPGHQPGTVMDTRNTMRVLLSVVPAATMVGDLTNDHLDAFFAFLPKIPTNARKLKAFRGMSLRAAAAKAAKMGLPTIEPRTQQKHLDRASVLFSWLFARRDIDQQLCDYLRSLRADKDDGGEAQARRPFTDAELATLFSPAMRARCVHPAQWWGPLIGLYTGARASEIAGLRTDSIEEANGIWGLHFVPRPGRRMKNGSSARFVPIHPALLDAGLLAYRDEVRAFLYAGDGPLLPNLHARHPGDSLGDWFNRTYMRKWCGIEDDRLVFHCFRNTFSSRGERASLSRLRISRLTGHSRHDDSTLEKHYIDPPTLPERDADMRRIVFPSVTLTPYQPRQFRAYLSKVLHNKRHLDRRASRKGTSP